MTMGDSTTNNEAAATMERLQLLSATALLKQGMEGAALGSQQNEGFADGKSKNRILETPSFGQPSGAILTSSANSPSSVSSATPKPIFSVASTASVPGLLMHGATSPEVESTELSNHINSINKQGNSSHLASPVSADGDEEMPVNSGSFKASSSIPFKIASSSGNALNPSVSNHSLQQMIESRSPVASVEYHRHPTIDASSASPASFGYPFQPRYDAPPAAFRPPMELSAFSAFGGTVKGDASRSFVPASVDSNGYISQHQQRQLPSPQHLSASAAKGSHVEKSPTYDDLVREVAFMREQLKEKDMVVSSLQHRVNFLENKISELRQLPTGKISHIPVDDMIRIMQEYGSEVSNQILPQRKHDIKKASIVRQFRRWNPEFFQYFIHVNGEWVPKLGREGELRRRAEKRRLLKQQPKVATK